MTKEEISVPLNPEFIPKYPTVGLNLWHCFKKYEDRVVQIDCESGEKQTYSDFLSRAVRTALTMQSRGITSDDIVSLCTDNHIDSWVPVLASFLLNIRISSIDPVLSLENIMHLLNITKPKIMFCIPQSVTLVKKAIENISIDCEIVLFGEAKGYTPFSTFLKNNSDEKHFVPKPVDPKSTAIIMFSSGTTGKAKAVELSHNLIYQSNSIGYHRDFNVSLFYSSPYWISNIIFKIITILNGGHRILCKSFDENSVVKIIEKYKVTFMFLSPAAIIRMISKSNWYAPDASSLKSFLYGGSYMTKKYSDELQKRLPRAIINCIYGMTETSGVITMFDEQLDQDIMKLKPSSCGRVVSGTCVKIVDIDSRQIVGPNMRGELLTKSPGIMNGFYKNPEETKNAFNEDGFIKTGDIAYYDEDKYFYIVDRLKEVFKYKSWRVSPMELEMILLTHRDISEAVIIGIPHKTDDNHAMALVVLKPGCVIKEDDILQYFNDRVTEENKLRAGVKLVKNILKTVTGKYCRFKIKQMVVNGEAID